MNASQKVKLQNLKTKNYLFKLHNGGTQKPTYTRYVEAPQKPCCSTAPYVYKYE